MKKIILLCLMLLTLTLIGCGKDNPETSFSKLITEASSYKADGVMESFYDTGKKENNFTVLYKDPDLIKVVITSTDDDENKQVILKNKEGVYILIPSVNKNFKIQSTWPDNASYPYLLHSLSKDIISDTNALKTETEQFTTIETTTKMYADAVPTKQKIIIDNATCLPTEVLVYDEQGNLYIRCVFKNIELDYNIPDDEFVVNASMIALRKSELTVFSEREFTLPSYIPDGYTTDANNTIVSGTDEDLTQIMKFTGENTFTVIQKYMNDNETLKTEYIIGDIVMVLGVPAIYSTTSVALYSEGMNYTLASSTMNFDELIRIVASYLQTSEK